MEARLKILPLDNQSSQQVIDLVLPIQQEEFNIPITLADQPDLTDLEAYYFVKGGHFWGAFADERLAGTIALLPFDGNTGIIRKMFVQKQFRGTEMEIAKKLLNTLLDHCIRNGMTNLYLGTVDVLKGAQRFYEKNGFARIAKESLPAGFPCMISDNVYYHINLSETKKLP